MALRFAACGICVAATGLIVGCSSPFDHPYDITRSLDRTLPRGVEGVPPSVYRDNPDGKRTVGPTLTADASPDEYIRYALYNSPEVEAATLRREVL